MEEDAKRGANGSEEGENRGSQATIGIVTVSDRAHLGIYEDLGGPEVMSYLNDHLSSPWEAEPRIVPDEKDTIEDVLREMCDVMGCCLVITTGGTGPSPRDVTPEATQAVSDRLLPGFGERMRWISAETVPTAILSRQEAYIRNRTLIVNLPGKPQAIRVCLDAIFDAVPPCIVHLGGPRIVVNTDAAKKAMRTCC